VMEIIRSLKTPTNYVAAIHKCLEEGKLRYMKSHDFHVLMQQVCLYFSEIEKVSFIEVRCMVWELLELKSFIREDIYYIIKLQ